MAGYNDHQSEGNPFFNPYNNGYVNFDQFMSQHNFHTFYGAAGEPASTMAYGNQELYDQQPATSTNFFQQQQQPPQHHHQQQQQQQHFGAGDVGQQPTNDFIPNFNNYNFTGHFPYAQSNNNNNHFIHDPDIVIGAVPTIAYNSTNDFMMVSGSMMSDGIRSPTDFINVGPPGYNRYGYMEDYSENDGAFGGNEIGPFEKKVLQNNLEIQTTELLDTMNATHIDDGSHHHKSDGKNMAGEMGKNLASNMDDNGIGPGDDIGLIYDDGGNHSGDRNHQNLLENKYQNNQNNKDGTNGKGAVAATIVDNSSGPNQSARENKHSNYIAKGGNARHGRHNNNYNDYRRSGGGSGSGAGSGRTASQYDDNYFNKYSFDQFSGGRHSDRRDHRDDKSYGGGGGGGGGSRQHYRDDENGMQTKDRYQSHGKNYSHRSDKSGSDRSAHKQHSDFKANRNLAPSKQLSNPIECSQREKLINEIDSSKLECLVCCEIIKPFHSAWSCSNCYHILHFQCIVKWASSSKSADGWRCPACQNITKKVPTDCYCFCGKQKDPAYNRNDVAHTCGELCGRTDGCCHPCTLLCHPGPCPPCQATVTRRCGCERTQKIMQCCQDEKLQCDQRCDKQLNCKEHTCERTCHLDACGACEAKLEHKCYCGKDKREVICSVDNQLMTRYSCGKICNRNLSCKAHKCKDICHDGECGRCKLLPDIVTSCPCGKSPILSGQRKSCTEPVPLCQAICGKPLKCGPPSNPHTCTNKCHTGNCSSCTKETAVRCRCGHMDQMVKCRLLSTRADDARCKKRCAKKRNCGKHKCNQECCIDIDHICPMPCNHSLSCGKHKCDQSCHRGRCIPCYRSSFDELYCECGANVIYPPVACGTKRPACTQPCRRTHPCDHPVQHNCHSATNCPPCMAFTTKYCYGKHEQRKTIPCSQGEFSCGLPCGKPLRCGQHKCLRPCHDDECQKADTVCKQNCPKSRVMCVHACNAPCHVGDCPSETVCRENVEVVCSCGNRKQIRPCFELQRESQRLAKAKLASTMLDMQHGDSADLNDVLNPAKNSDSNRVIECNEECKVLERNRRLDAAWGETSATSITSIIKQTKYSDFIKSWAKKDPNLVGMIHDKLTELVKLAKDNKQRSRSHSFPTMNREKRQLVHEMCEMFGVESVAYDAEPNRNVVAIAKDTCWLPCMSIFEILQRESGQRRIPVPNNNAWGTVKR